MDGQIAAHVMDERLQRLQARINARSTRLQSGHRGKSAQC
jgi:hypothetical protein